MTKLTAEAKGLKGALVSALLSASYSFITARRVVAGVSLLHALLPPSMMQRLVAAATVAVLAPVYALAQKLVFSKVGVCCLGLYTPLTELQGSRLVQVAKSGSSCRSADDLICMTRLLLQRDKVTTRAISS